MASEPAIERGALDEMIESLPPIREITEQEFWDQFDSLARRRLGISGKEFLRRWDAGEWQEDSDQPGIITLEGMLPFLPDTYRESTNDEH